MTIWRLRILSAHSLLGLRVACLSVRGTRDPHTGHVGKMVSVFEDLRSGKGHRTGPCERVRHTNITKINQMQIHAVVRDQVQT